MIDVVREWVLSTLQSPVAGWGLAIFLICAYAIKRVSETVSALQIIKSRILIPFANKFKFKKLEKAAIKSDIEGNLNKAVKDIENELPQSWIEPLSIKWVDSEDKNEFMKDNQAVIRLKPLEAEVSNFSRAVYFYFKNSFFPYTRSALPKSHFEAATLQFSRRVIRQSKSEALSEFEEAILEPTIRRMNNVANYLERLESIDERGLFTGVFLREVHEIASKARFTTQRKNLGSEFTRVLRHLEEFLQEYHSKERVTDYKWNRQGPVCSYGLILVAQSNKAAQGLINGYVHRAQDRANDKIDHLYVFGAEEERKFTKEVINSIVGKVPQYELTEVFDLHRDYRGKPGGTGALFVISDSQN